MFLVTLELSRPLNQVIFNNPRLDLTSRMVPQIQFTAWVAESEETHRSVETATVDVSLEDRALVS